jgi:hypothetical protein
MKITILLITLVFSFAAFQDADIKLEVGATLPAKSVPPKNRKMYMTHSAQFRPYIRKEIKGIKYIIAYDEKNLVIKYISTHDQKFKSANGLKVGDYVEVNDEQLAVYPGWEIRGPEDKDGWQTLIGFDSEMTVLDEKAETKIKLRDYHLEQPVKAKILAFVKGGN